MVDSVNAVTRTVAMLTVLPPAPPSIVTPPADLTASEGQTAVFDVVADGYAPLSYQWFFNTNTPLANQTNAFLALANVQSARAGAIPF